MKLSKIYEDYHGGDVQSAGQFPVDTLERSQSRKGSPNLFVHPDDSGQAGVSERTRKKRAGKKKNKVR